MPNAKWIYKPLIILPILIVIVFFVIHLISMKAPVVFDCGGDKEIVFNTEHKKYKLLVPIKIKGELTCIQQNVGQ